MYRLMLESVKTMLFNIVAVVFVSLMIDITYNWIYLLYSFVDWN